MGKVLFLIVFVTFGCFGAMKTDTVKAIGNIVVVKDTTKFLKKVSAPVVNADSFAVGSGTALTKCTTGTFQCSLFDNTTYRAVVTAKFSVFGSTGNYTRRVYIPALYGTCSSGYLILNGFPNILRDNTETYHLVVSAYDSAAAVYGLMSVPPPGNDITLTKPANFSGTSGLNEVSIVY